MKTASEYRTTTDFALLLVGPPFSGKTNTAMAFEKPYFLDCDAKLSNAISRFKDKEFFYDIVDTDDNGNTVPEAQRWTRLTTLAKLAAVDPRPRTLVVDSLSKVSTYLIDHIIANGGSKLTVGGEKVMEQQHWQPFKILMTRFITTLRASKKLVIFTAHEKVDKDEVTGVLNYQPLIPGQLANNIGMYFTDVWRCDAVPAVDSTKGTMYTKYTVRTQPTARMMLGTSLGLPVEFEMSWDILKEKLKQTETKAI